MRQSNAKRNVADHRDALRVSFIDEGVVNRERKVVIYLYEPIAVILVATHELARSLCIGRYHIRWPGWRSSIDYRRDHDQVWTKQFAPFLFSGQSQMQRSARHVAN